MSATYTANEKMNWILYVVFIIALAIGIQFFIEWMLNNAVFPVLNWFNRLALLWKLLIILVGAPSLIYILGALVGVFHAFIVLFLFKNLPANKYVNTICLIIFAVNVFICIRDVWFVMPSWGFWYILEFILLCLFCFAANYSILYTLNRDKKNREAAYME